MPLARGAATAAEQFYSWVPWTLRSEILVDYTVAVGGDFMFGGEVFFWDDPGVFLRHFY